MTRAALVALVLLIPGAAAAQTSTPTFIVESLARPDGGPTLEASVLVLNGTSAPLEAAAEPLAGRLSCAGQLFEVVLNPVDMAQTIAPGAFLRRSYRAAVPQGCTNGALSLGLAQGQQIVHLDSQMEANPAQAPIASDAAAAPRAPGRLTTYEPLYLALGQGTNTNGKIQLSFRYRIFGKPPGPWGTPTRWSNTVNAAYTQQMFWDTSADSAPFRNIDFMPELHYRGERRFSSGGGFAIQLGAQHVSNGQGDEDSRSLNNIYLQPELTLASPVLQLTIAPRAWVYVGDDGDNPDIEDYRGNTGLGLRLGFTNGLQINANSRFALDTGRAAVDGTITYPLGSPLGEGANIYLVVQAFTGYGENLLDYRDKDSRLRVGFGFSR